MAPGSGGKPGQSLAGLFLIFYSFLKVKSLPKKQNFHAKTQSRKDITKKNSAYSLRLSGFA
jgi:hypothetical protein